MFNKKCWLLCITICSLLFIFIVQNKINLGRSLKKKDEVIFIPNLVHYILFDKNSINFISYLSILSVLRIQKPSVIYIHTNHYNLTGNYWRKLLQFASSEGSVIAISFLMKPTHVYGQYLSSVYHASDIARLHVLQKYGGIYLDGDMLMINNVNNLRMYNCVIGKPKNQYIGSQFIMAKSTSKFIKLWQEGYKRYRPRDWYYNAGQYPTEILEKHESLVHIEPEYFGVHNLLDTLLSTEKWESWKQYYSIHALSRHNEVFNYLDEFSVQNMTTNIAIIARWILDLP